MKPVLVSPSPFSTFLPLLRMYDEHHSGANCPQRCGPGYCRACQRRGGKESHEPHDLLLGSQRGFETFPVARSARCSAAHPGLAAVEQGSQRNRANERPDDTTALDDDECVRLSALLR